MANVADVGVRAAGSSTTRTLAPASARPHADRRRGRRGRGGTRPDDPPARSLTEGPPQTRGQVRHCGTLPRPGRACGTPFGPRSHAQSRVRVLQGALPDRRAPRPRFRDEDALPEVRALVPGAEPERPTSGGQTAFHTAGDGSSARLRRATGRQRQERAARTEEAPVVHRSSRRPGFARARERRWTSCDLEKERGPKASPRSRADGRCASASTRAVS